MNAKTCRQCGELKPLEQFRQYYGGRTGRYTLCKACERINSRLKYLESKKSLTELEKIELDKIYKLYDVQRAAGLRPPQRGVAKQPALGIDLDAMIGKYKIQEVSLVANAPVPIELGKWLTEELTEEPEYYISHVYEELCKTFKPVLSLDKVTMSPVYDETYADILSRILSRFYDYEDRYYEED